MRIRTFFSVLVVVLPLTLAGCEVIIVAMLDAAIDSALDDDDCEFDGRRYNSGRDDDRRNAYYHQLVQQQNREKHRRSDDGDGYKRSRRRAKDPSN